jgi:hypothetical protein
LCRQLRFQRRTTTLQFIVLSYTKLAEKYFDKTASE